VDKLLIPNNVIYVVGDVLGQWYYSHTKLDTLFGEAGATGDPPLGNCVGKAQQWLKRVNQESESPLEILGNVMTPFMSLELASNDKWKAGVDRINAALQKGGLCFDPTGKIVDESPSVTIDRIDGAITMKDSLSRKPTLSSRAPNVGDTTRVFVVHGHDDGLKNTVARFLQTLHLDPVILHEQPDRGRTIIEKFEQWSAVNFAVALFTADDLGNSKKNASSADPRPSPPQPRARQNVVLEFGYFLGKLGRANVCAIVDKSIELPSDYSGVLFLPLDQWQQGLLDALAEAGFQLDSDAMRQAIKIK
jgi:predicted nucleotide-binding protein